MNNSLSKVPLFHITRRKELPWYRAWLIRVIAVIMGLITFLAYRLFVYLQLDLFATKPAMIVAVISYMIALLALGGLTRPEILQMPGGARLVRILDRFHLLRRPTDITD